MVDPLGDFDPESWNLLFAEIDGILEEWKREPVFEDEWFSKPIEPPNLP